MSVLPAQSIRNLCRLTRETQLIVPCCERSTFEGMTYGLSSAGYDIRVAEDVALSRKDSFKLCSSMERFKMPDDLIAFVHDKSSWARKGVAVQNTVIEPGWEGYLTMELSLHSDLYTFIRKGSPIAQIVFHTLTTPTLSPYKGKYQNQEAGPQAARYES